MGRLVTFALCFCKTSIYKKNGCHTPGVDLECSPVYLEMSLGGVQHLATLHYCLAHGEEQDESKDRILAGGFSGLHASILCA